MAQVSMRIAEAVDEWNHRHAPRWTFPLCKRLCDWREIQYGAPVEMVRAETGGWTTQFDADSPTRRWMALCRLAQHRQSKEYR